MQFKCKKTNNCFPDAETYEYKTDYTNEYLRKYFEGMGNYSVNYKFKKPIFFLDLHDKTNVKGVMNDSFFKASFFGDSAFAKKNFERILENIQP